MTPSRLSFRQTRRAPRKTGTSGQDLLTIPAKDILPEPFTGQHSRPAAV